MKLIHIVWFKCFNCKINLNISNTTHWDTIKNKTHVTDSVIVCSKWIPEGLIKVQILTFST